MRPRNVIDFTIARVTHEYSMSHLLLSRTCQPESEGLPLVARAAGWRHRWLGPREMHRTLPPGDLAFYGEVDLAAALVAGHPVRLIEPSFDLLAHIPQEFTKRRIEFMTLGETRRLTRRVFVKPADCWNKIFEPAVVDSGDRLRCPERAAPETPVLVSDPVSWTTEFRVVLHERRVTTLSPYIRDGWLARNEHGAWPSSEDETRVVRSFCERLLEDSSLDLPPAVVMDVGQIASAGWAVVEFNPVWCSGLLGCDLQKVLPALARACRRADEVQPVDWKWILERRAT
jgi:hypothetical protein